MRRKKNTRTTATTASRAHPSAPSVGAMDDAITATTEAAAVLRLYWTITVVVALGSLEQLLWKRNECCKIKQASREEVRMPRVLELRGHGHQPSARANLPARIYAPRRER